MLHEGLYARSLDFSHLCEILLEIRCDCRGPTGAYAVMAQGAVASLTQGDVVIWIADDRLGTPRDIVNNSATLANHIVFSAYGAEVYQSDPSVTDWAGFGGGHLSAAAQLILDGLRWEDPTQGRWLNFDPASFHGGDANLARYAGNDPTNVIDRSGEISNMAIAAALMFPWLIPGMLAAAAFGAQQARPAVAPPLVMPAIPGLGPAQIPPAPQLAQQQIVAAIAPNPPQLPPAPQMLPLPPGVVGGAFGGMAVGGVIGVVGAVLIVAAAPAITPVVAGAATVFAVGALIGGTLGGGVAGQGQNNMMGGLIAAVTSPTPYIGAIGAGEFGAILIGAFGALL